MSIFASITTTTMSANKTQPVKGRAPPRTSRPWLLVASGLFTVAVFLLDGQALQAQQLGTSSYELFFIYALGLAAAGLYVVFVGQDVSKAILSVRRRYDSVRASFRKVCNGFVKLGEIFKCPRPAEERQPEERPPVPFWVLVAMSILCTVMAASLVVMSFTALPQAEERVSFLDAPFRCDKAGSHQRASRNWTWLVAAFGLSSGLCVVHPLQSGLILGF